MPHGFTWARAKPMSNPHRRLAVARNCCTVTRNLVPGWFHPLCQVGEVDMAISRQDLRKLERLVGRSQAKALARKIEARAQQAARRAARGTGSQQAAARTEAVIIKELVTKKRAGWVNEPGKSHAVLVEARTGCLVLDSKRKVITKPKTTLPSKPAINKSTFLLNLKSQGIEEYVPHMYLDEKGNVTVGIGHLLPKINDATPLPFIKRDTNVAATVTEIEQDFNRVKQSGLVNTKAPAFKPLTSLIITEADATKLALDDMDDFLRILRHPGTSCRTIA